MADENVPILADENVPLRGGDDDAHEHLGRVGHRAVDYLSNL